MKIIVLLLAGLAALLGLCCKIAEWVFYNLPSLQDYVFGGPGEWMAKASWLAGDLFTGVAIMMLCGGLLMKASSKNNREGGRQPPSLPLG